MDSIRETRYQEYLAEKLDAIFEDKSYSKKSPNYHRRMTYKDKRFKLIKRFGKYNFAGLNGKPISEEWFDAVFDFVEGMAKVKSGNFYKFINENGDLVGPVWYLGACDYKDGFAAVNNGTSFSLIDKKGKLLGGRYFFDVKSFSEGVAKVEDGDNNCNYIKSDGTYLFDKWLPFTVSSFREGFAVIGNAKRGYANAYRYMDKEGNILSTKWYRNAYDFSDGVARVYDGSKYNYIDKTGKPISDEWFEEACDFKCGIGLVKIDNKYTFINKEGKPVNEEITDVEVQAYGFAVVRVNGKQNVMDTNGNYVSDVWFDKEVKVEVISNCFYRVNNKYYPTYNFIRDNKVVVSKKGYTFIKDGVTISVKHEPLMVYGTSYVLCRHRNGKNILLYDIKNDRYKDVGSVETLEYDENFIINHRNYTVDLVYGDQVIDVTEYYCKKLQGKKEITVDKGITLLRREDFEFETDEEITERIKKGKEKEKADAEERQRLEEKKQLLKLKQEAIIAEKERQAMVANAYKIIREQSAIIKDNYRKTGVIERMPAVFLYVNVEDHLKINPEYIDNLMCIDLQLESFENVDVRNVDFSCCNISGLNPQLVYNKDLSGCNFEKVHFTPLTVFDGVNIKGARFSDDDNELTVDIPPAFVNAIWDENTTYNNVSFVKLFGPCPCGSGKKI